MILRVYGISIALATKCFSKFVNVTRKY